MSRNKVAHMRMKFPMLNSTAARISHHSKKCSPFSAAFSPKTD